MAGTAKHIDHLNLSAEQSRNRSGEQSHGGAQPGLSTLKSPAKLMRESVHLGLAGGVLEAPDLRAAFENYGRELGRLSPQFFSQLCEAEERYSAVRISARQSTSNIIPINGGAERSLATTTVAHSETRTVLSLLSKFQGSGAFSDFFSALATLGSEITSHTK